MTRKPSDKDRIATLEAELQSLRDAIERTQSRLDSAENAPQMRLAKTISKDDDPGTNPYPSGSADTFYMKLIEGEFTEEEGVQALTQNARASGHSGVVRTVPPRFIDSGTVIPVFRYGGRWISPTAAAESGIVRFETTAAKAHGANVAAETVEYAASVYSKTGTEIAVVDTFGRWGPSLSGAQGFAVARPDRETVDLGGGDLPAYEILWIEAKARWIRFTLSTDMLSQSATATVNDYWGDALNGQNPGASVTVRDEINTFGAGEIGDQGVAVLNEGDDEYEIVNLPIPVCRTLQQVLGIPTTGSDDYVMILSTDGTCDKEIVEECDA